MRSLNFEFLQTHEPLLVKLGAAAERYCFDDPNVSLYKLRQFGELLAQMAAQMVDVPLSNDRNQNTLLRDLAAKGVIRGDVDRLFHAVRKTGNDAVHSLVGTQRMALDTLKYACFLGIWFHRTFGGQPDFRVRFIPPQLEPVVEIGLEQTLLQKEVDRLHAELAEQVSAAELAEVDRLRQAQLLEDLEKSVQQSEVEKQQIQQRLTELQTVAQAMPQSKRQLLVRQAGDAQIDLDESATRRLIDQQLRDAGWEVDTEQLTDAAGVRPEKGRNLAIAEYPIGRRSADYVLFIGLEAVAVIEAKRRHKNVQSGALGQAVDRYAKKQYRSVIFCHTPIHMQVAKQSKLQQERSGKYDLPIVTEIQSAGDYWLASEEHQQYLEKKYKS
jgi:type I restriction enzyme, R subunit